MKKRSSRGLRRFRVEVQSWGNYVERIAELEKALSKKPRVLSIEIVGAGEIPADVALRFRAAFMERSPKTRICTHARSSLQGGSVLLWLLGDNRSIREDARLYFRPTTLSEEDVVLENGRWDISEEPKYRDSCSEFDPEEGDYARVLQFINEFLPVRELAGRLIGIDVLRQFSLVESERVDNILATLFSNAMKSAAGSMNETNQQFRQRPVKGRSRRIGR